MDSENDARRLLSQLEVLRRPSDLDLLVFFARHPRSLLSSEQIAAFVGHDVKEVAASLELLLEAGFLTRTQNPRHVARMYHLAVPPPGGGWLPALTGFATTREGRLALIEEIRRRSLDGLFATNEGAAVDTTPVRPLQFPRVRLASERSRRKRSTTPMAVPSSEPRTRGRRGGEQ
jgi:hypothetical protein